MILIIHLEDNLLIYRKGMGIQRFSFPLTNVYASK